MTNEIFTMSDKHTVRTRTQHNTESCNLGSNLLLSVMRMSNIAFDTKAVNIAKSSGLSKL